jgi:Putative stress-responsive transcriptional regulator
MAYHSPRQLYRTDRGSVVAGVCAGLSEYLSLDVSIIRLIFVFLSFGYGSALLVYIVLWIVLPKR